MRLGELLIDVGALTQEALRQALQEQSETNDRLGSVLIRSGLASPDEVAIALGKQHRVMPALVRHLVHHDPQVLRFIMAQTAASHGLLPIAYAGASDQKLVVCFRDPTQKAVLEKLADQLNLGIVPCVASELTMKAYWQHYYASSPGEDELEQLDVNVDDFEVREVPDNIPDSGYAALQLVDLDDSGVEKLDRGIFLFDSGARSALEMASKKAPDTTASNKGIAKPEAAPKAIADVLSEIAQAQDRSTALESLMSFLRYRFGGGLFFTVKDGLAMGLEGFGGHLDDPETVLALMLPVNAGMLGYCMNNKKRWFGQPSSCNTAAQARFLKLFALPEEHQAVAFPIQLGQRVIALLYVHGKSELLDDKAVDELALSISTLQTTFAGIVQRARAERQRS